MNIQIGKQNTPFDEKHKSEGHHGTLYSKFKTAKIDTGICTGTCSYKIELEVNGEYVTVFRRS